MMKRTQKKIVFSVIVVLLIALAVVLILKFGKKSAETDSKTTPTPTMTVAPTEGGEKVTEVPKATEEPKATEAPNVTVTPEATKAPETTEIPEVTDVPEPTTAPNEDEPTPTAAPDKEEPTKAPEATESPEGPTPIPAPTFAPTPTPEATPTPKPTKAPTAAPTATLKPTATPKATVAPTQVPPENPNEDKVMLMFDFSLTYDGKSTGDYKEMYLEPGTQVSYTVEELVDEYLVQEGVMLECVSVLKVLGKSLTVNNQTISGTLEDDVIVSFILTKKKDQTPANHVSKVKSPNVGDIVTMGKFEQDNNLSNGAEDIKWIVLDVNDRYGKMLIMTVDALKCVVFEDRTADYKANWETSYAREWLNLDFYNTAFTHAERDMILESKCEDANAEEQIVRVPGDYYKLGGSVTYDKVFVLSVQEAHGKYKLGDMEYFRQNGIHQTAFCRSDEVAQWGFNTNSLNSEAECISRTNGPDLGYYHYFLLTNLNGVRDYYSLSGTCNSNYQWACILPTMWVEY